MSDAFEISSDRYLEDPDNCPGFPRPGVFSVLSLGPPMGGRPDLCIKASAQPDTVGACVGP